MTTLSPVFAYTRRESFNPAFSELLRSFAARPLREETAQAAVRAIRFDVAEQGANYVVTADLPGMRKEDIQVEIDGARVTITAEPRVEAEPKDGERVLYSERRVGKAVRSFELGAEIDQAAASARYADGVLVLTLPKKVVETRKLLAIQ